MADGLAMAMFGTLLSIIAGLMVWQALSIIKAGNRLVAVETLLKSISQNLEKIATHDSMIAVLNSEVNNLKSETTLLFQKVEILEREKFAIHRR